MIRYIVGSAIVIACAVLIACCEVHARRRERQRSHRYQVVTLDEFLAGLPGEEPDR